jgi:hypothetical protein
LVKCKCGNEISEARLRAVPGVRTCIACAPDKRVVGLMVWDHKTAPTLEIGTKLARNSAGRKHRYGVHISLAQEEGHFGVGPGMRAMIEEAEITQDRVSKARGITESEPEVEPVLRPEHTARCHPDRHRVGPSGRCAQCEERLGTHNQFATTKSQLTWRRQ